MKRTFLIALVVGIYLFANFIAIYYITSYGYTLSLFKSSEHHQKVKYYQDKWDVPVWVGEFCWETHLMPESPLMMPTWLWTSSKFSNFRYLIDESMVRVVNDEEGWGWSYWEYEKVAFSDEKMNQVFSKYMKGSWKPNDSIPKLIVKGKEIQTEDGRPVILKGPSLPLKHLAYFSELEPSESVFQKLDKMGANVVRIINNFECLRPREGEWNQKSFETLKQALDLAEKHHIYVILDAHQYKGSSYFFQGAGFPPWYVQRYAKGFGEDYQKFNEMWINRQAPYEDSWDFVIETWKRIIDVSKGRNIVVGYDLFNEPHGEPHKFYEYLSARIEPLDPGKIHFAETTYVFRGMDSEEKPDIHNLVLSPHLYSDVWPRMNFTLVMFITSTLLPVILVVIAFLPFIKVGVSRLWLRLRPRLRCLK